MKMYYLERWRVLIQFGRPKRRYTGVPAVLALLLLSVSNQHANKYIFNWTTTNQVHLQLSKYIFNLLLSVPLSYRRYYYETVPQPGNLTIEDIISPQNSSAKLNSHRRLSCLWYCFVADIVAGESSVQETLLSVVLFRSRYCRRAT